MNGNVCIASGNRIALKKVFSPPGHAKLQLCNPQPILLCVELSN